MNQSEEPWIRIWTNCSRQLRRRPRHEPRKSAVRQDMRKGSGARRKYSSTSTSPIREPRRRLSAACRPGKPLGGAPTFQQRVAAAAVTQFGYFPKGRKSPDQVLPRGMPPEKIVADIGPQIDAMDKIIAQCEERYGSRVRVLDHPVLGPLTARQSRKIDLAHGRHHVKQILAPRRPGARLRD